MAAEPPELGRDPSERPGVPPGDSPEGTGVPPEGGARSSPGLFDLLAMSLTTAMLVGGGLGLGLLVDSLAHSSPFGVFGGLVLGIVAAVGSTVRQVRKFL